MLNTRPPVNALPLVPGTTEEMFSWVGIVSRGVEEVATEELRAAGATDIQPFRSGVRFQASLPTVYRIHLSAGSITRVLLPIREFAAGHTRMLYDQVRRVAWEKLIRSTDTLAIDCTASGQAGAGSAPPGRDDPGLPAEADEERRPGRILRGQAPARRVAAPAVIRPAARPPTARAAQADPGMRNTHYVSLKIKDAIVDRIREETGARPNVDTESPTYRVFAHLSAGPATRDAPPAARCTLSLDATGTSLHERGYRVPGALAPLRETLASAIISLSGWKGDVPLLDPMCGSATLLIEAARKALGAPNLRAGRRFGFMNWPSFDLGAWNEAKAEAEARHRAKLDVPIFGFDSSSKALMTAKQSARGAGVDGSIEFLQREIKDLAPPPGVGPGMIITNPPYGERVGEMASLGDLYYRLGQVLRERFQGWTVYILSGNAELTSHLGLKASRRFPLFNGPIECRLLRYEIRGRESGLRT